MFRQLSNRAASLLVFGGLGMAGIVHSVAGAPIVPLNGWTPDVVDTNNATWSAGSYIQVDSGQAVSGSAGYVANGTVGSGTYTFNGYLPFSPVAGHIYTLTATLNPIADWIGFGFATGNTINSNPWQAVNNPSPWMLANSGGAGIQWFGGSSSYTTSSSPTTPTTYSIVLNTSTGTEYNGGWTTQLLQGNTALYNPSPFYETNSNLAISSVGLAQDANNSGGDWQNFTLTDKNLATGTTTTIYQDSFGAPSTPQVLASGTIVPDTQFNYMYAPSAMYDQTDGLYKIWTTYNTSSMSGGDRISFENATSLAALSGAPVTTALNPSSKANYFDQVDVADPSVYRDPATGNYYMAYDGNTDGSQLASETRIGIAVSTNGGQTFTPLYTNNAANGYALIAPGTNFVAGSYGVGQPAVVQANNGLWYMIYTDAPNSAQTPTFQVISSSSPTFRKHTHVVTLSQNTVGSSSLDLAYDPTTSEFITIANTTNITQIGDNSIQLTFFNSNWNPVRYLTFDMNNQTFSFGEGVALLTNAEKQLLDPYLMNFFGATVNAADLANNVPAYWVKGNFDYLTAQSSSPISLTASQSSQLAVPESSSLSLLAIGGGTLIMLVGRNSKRLTKCVGR